MGTGSNPASKRSYHRYINDGIRAGLRKQAVKNARAAIYKKWAAEVNLNGGSMAGKEPNERDSHLKAIAAQATEGANYLKSMKRAASSGQMTQKQAFSLVEITRTALDAIEARLKGMFPPK